MLLKWVVQIKLDCFYSNKTIECLSWFNPKGQLSPTQLLTHSPRVGIGKRIGRVKARKLEG